VEGAGESAGDTAQGVVVPDPAFAELVITPIWN
jgi:hypothetical protein